MKQITSSVWMHIDTATVVVAKIANNVTAAWKEYTKTMEGR